MENNFFKDDFFRYTKKKWSLHKYFKYLLFDHGIWYLYLLRRQSTSKAQNNLLLRFLLKNCTRKYGIEISPESQIGKGLYLGHAFNIGVNPGAVLGNNVNLHKGVSIGKENRGKRKGAPVIGSCVWIGINATVVGRVSVGNDVLIASNAFVNVDVPSHSIVIGNPCRIIPHENATEGYLQNIVDE